MGESEEQSKGVHKKVDSQIERGGNEVEDKYGVKEWRRGKSWGGT